MIQRDKRYAIIHKDATVSLSKTAFRDELSEVVRDGAQQIIRQAVVELPRWTPSDFGQEVFTKTGQLQRSNSVPATRRRARMRRPASILRPSVRVDGCNAVASGSQSQRNHVRESMWR